MQLCAKPAKTLAHPIGNGRVAVLTALPGHHFHYEDVSIFNRFVTNCNDGRFDSIGPTHSRV